MNDQFLICKNIRIAGHRTSMRLEKEVWSALAEIGHREHCDTNEICACVNSTRSTEISLTAAVRIFVITYFRRAATEDGHLRAGHGSRNSPLHYQAPDMDGGDHSGGDCVVLSTCG